MLNISWGEVLVLLVVGLVVLGPERLPGAIHWTANALRQARDYVSKSTENLREELGPEFDDLREPLSELQKLRGMTPRAAITRHLLDGDDSLLNGVFDNHPPALPEPAATPPEPSAKPPEPTAQASEQSATVAPFDQDAT
jgi:sec-independent protein translocase protein TatB